MKKLRLQWIKFADEYIKLGNAYQAAINAGYSENYAKAQSSKLLENVGIKAYIEERMKKLEEEAIASQTEVLKYLTSVMRGEEVDEVLMAAGDYVQEKTELRVSNKDRIRAAELIGKRHQMWTDKVNLEGNLPVIIYGEDEIED